MLNGNSRKKNHNCFKQFLEADPPLMTIEPLMFQQPKYMGTTKGEKTQLKKGVFELRFRSNFNFGFFFFLNISMTLYVMT
jgi:hypothetical protein